MGGYRNEEGYQSNYMKDARASQGNNAVTSQTACIGHHYFSNVLCRLMASVALCCIVVTLMVSDADGK